MQGCSVSLNDGWARQGGVSARGFAFHDGVPHDCAALCRLFASVATTVEFARLLRATEGFFAVVCQTADGVLAAVDRVRSIPLFYRVQGSTVSVADRATALVPTASPLDFDPLAREEFRLTGFVTGRDTLVPGIKQIQAGEMLLFAEVHGAVAVTTSRYFRFRTGTAFASAPQPEQLLEELDDVANQCIARLIARAAGRTIVLPLSGGWDSRLIATTLRRQRYDNVVSFTYGRIGNLQSAISRSVASSLGFQWEMVPYSEAAWHAWFHSEGSKSYAMLAHNFVSVPHYQDWPAIWELQKRGVLDQEAIIVPGHLGGLVSGDHFPVTLLHAEQVTREKVIDTIYEKHYNLWNVSDSKRKDELKNRAGRYVSNNENFQEDEATCEIEEFDWQERQAKFIVNSVRVYDHWGYEWWMPLADSHYVSFWMKVPNASRAQQALYKSYVTRMYADVGGVSAREARERDGVGLVQRAAGAAKKFGCYNLARAAYRTMLAPVLGLRDKNTAYTKDPLAWYGIMDVATFRREFSGRENLHSFVTSYILGDVVF